MDSFLNSLLSGASNLLGNPTPAKTLVDTLRGDKSDITESNFSSEELEFIKKLIGYQTRLDEDAREVPRLSGNIKYSDYRDYALGRMSQGDRVWSMSPGLSSLFDPYGRVMTTLGQFGYSVDPKTNEINIKDQYDFNPQTGAGGRTGAASGSEVIGAMFPYAGLRSYAGQQIPPGSGRNVNIRIK